jgi:HK97 family phage portal protein
MNWLQRTIRNLALGTAKRALKYAGIPLRDPALVAIFGRNDVTSGVDINEDTALNASAVYSAVNLIAGSVAMMPCYVYKKNVKSADDAIATNHIVNRLLAVSPNPYATPFVFHQTHQAHVLTHGNSYMEIQRANGKGSAPVGLRTLLPDNVNVKFEDDGEMVYELNERGPDGKPRRLNADDVIHVPGLGYDGTRGYSVVSRAREAIGLNIATERYGASFFGRGAIPGGVITHPGDLSPEAELNLARDFERKHRGPDNGHRIAVLDEGMKYTQIGLPPEDSQFLQTRQFQIVEIARWFRTPPHMLYDLTQATFSNIEQQNIDFLTYTILPWLLRWQQEYTRKLLTPREQEQFTVGHDTTVLLMSDMASRFSAYNTARNGGWYTLNDILRRERLPLLPPEIGDVHLAPSTMKVLGKDDPTVPIDPQVMTQVVAYIQSVKPVRAQTATLIYNAAMPTATAEFVKSQVDTLKSMGLVA